MYDAFKVRNRAVYIDYLLCKEEKVYMFTFKNME